MMTTERIFTVSRQGAALIVLPHIDLGELQLNQFREGVEEISALLEDEEIRHVVFDLGECAYLGSGAMTWFLALRKRLRPRGGGVALCRLSERAEDVLALMRLDGVLAVHATCEEALRAAGGE